MRKKNIDITQEQILEGTVQEILKLKEETVKNILSIGHKLNFIKLSIPHGEFGKYIEEKVGFTQRTAQKFMKIAESFHDANAPSCLGIEKLYLITTIPEKEREEFINENNIEEMSTRELKKKIKETKNPVTEKEQKTESKIIDVEVIEAEEKPIEEGTENKSLEYLKEQRKNIINKRLEFLKENTLEYQKINEKIDKICDEKRLYDQLQFTVTLSELLANTQAFLQTNLSPFMYSRALKHLDNAVVAKNLLDMINLVDNWSCEIKQKFPTQYRDKNIIDVDIMH